MNDAGSSFQRTSLLKGVAHDFEYLEVDAATISGIPAASFVVPPDEEHLIIVKSGEMKISFADSSWVIGQGSIALLLPGESVSMSASGHHPCNFYVMRYRSKDPVNIERGRTAGGSFVKDWNRLVFRAHDRGGVRSYFERATAMSKRFEMHVTTLKPGLKSHDPHTHRAEEIILMLDDTSDGKCSTEMLIGDKYFHGREGDLYYVGTGQLHGIRNTGSIPCSYFAFQFE
jgi:(S)-ureidoglycine aminohydrolase